MVLPPCFIALKTLVISHKVQLFADTRKFFALILLLANALRAKSSRNF